MHRHCVGVDQGNDFIEVTTQRLSRDFDLLAGTTTKACCDRRQIPYSAVARSCAQHRPSVYVLIVLKDFAALSNHHWAATARLPPRPSWPSRSRRVPGIAVPGRDAIGQPRQSQQYQGGNGPQIHATGAYDVALAGRSARTIPATQRMPTAISSTATE